MVFDPLSWALSFTLSKVVGGAGKSLFNEDLTARLQQRVKEWAAELPPSAFVQPEVLFSAVRAESESAGVSPALKRLGQTLLSDIIPRREDWEAAFVERWKNVKAKISDPQPFFMLDVDEATALLRDLSERVVKECQKDQSLFQVTVLHFLEQLHALPQTESDRRDSPIALDIISVDVPCSAIGFGEVRFVLSNSGTDMLLVTGLSLHVLNKTQSKLTLLHVPAGPIDEYFLFARLAESTTQVDLLESYHQLLPSHADAFFLRIDAVDGYEYTFTIEVLWRQVGTSEQRMRSEPFTIAFPAWSIEAQLRLTNNL